jgi:hypothetical protein
VDDCYALDTARDTAGTAGNGRSVGTAEDVCS